MALIVFLTKIFTLCKKLDLDANSSLHLQTSDKCRKIFFSCEHPMVNELKTTVTYDLKLITRRIVFLAFFKFKKKRKNSF